MVHGSPILSFAIELFVYAMELQTKREARERKLAVMHLAQVVELAVKAALVERNIPIYTADGRTLNTHAAQEALAKARTKTLPFRARGEILIDERNGIQHRYGHVDDATLDYHLETATEFLREILDEEFDIDLDALVRGSVDPAIWRSVRFIRSDEPAPPPSVPAATPAASPVAAMLGGFANFERRLRDRLRALALDERVRSVLDVTMKFLGGLSPVDSELLQRVPAVFTRRNAMAHGVGEEATAEQVAESLEVLDRVVNLLEQPENEGALRSAVNAHQRRRMGVSWHRADTELGPPDARANGGQLEPE